MKIAAAYRQVIERFTEAGIVDPGADAALLLAHVLGTTRDRLILFLDQEFAAPKENLYSCLVRRRLAHEPVQYLLGVWWFHGLELEVGPEALIPRHDTEDWLDAFLPRLKERFDERVFCFADIGTGTGAIGLTLANEFRAARGFLCDISSDALLLAGRNVKRHIPLAAFLVLVQTDLLEAFDAEKFELIISNPPYIDSAEIQTLMPEVRNHEPRIALDGGENGLETIRRLLTTAGTRLKPGGLLTFEHGHGQREAILHLPSPGLHLLEFGDDCGGRERYIIFEKSLP